MINLERSVKRRAYMERSLKAMGLDFEYIPAVNGKGLSKEERAKLCDLDAIAQHPEWLTPGAIGCSLSHYHIYDKMVKEDVSYALILEDDVDLSAEVPRIIKEIEEHHTEILDRELIFMYVVSREVMRFKKVGRLPIGDGRYIGASANLRRKGASGAYFISKPVAEKMRDIILPVRVSADTWHFFRDEGCYDNIRCILPFCGIPAMFESDIGYLKKGSLKDKVKYVFNSTILLRWVLVAYRKRYWKTWSRWRWV